MWQSSSADCGSDQEGGGLQQAYGYELYGIKRMESGRIMDGLWSIMGPEQRHVVSRRVRAREMSRNRAAQRDSETFSHRSRADAGIEETNRRNSTAKSLQSAVLEQCHRVPSPRRTTQPNPERISDYMPDGSTYCRPRTHEASNRYQPGAPLV